MSTRVRKKFLPLLVTNRAKNKILTLFGDHFHGKNVYQQG